MMKLKYIIPAILILFGLNSCEEYLDVNPETETVNDDVYTDAESIEEALYGIYIVLSEGTLYGENLGWSWPAILSQDFKPNENISVNNYLVEYDYNSIRNGTVSTDDIDVLWNRLYEVTGYVNNIIQNLEAIENNGDFEYYELYLGEAYGLRALLHFETLKWFAPHYETANGANEEAIPYTTEYSFQIAPFLTTSEVYDNLVADLKKAQNLLVEDEGLFLAYPRDYSDYYSDFTKERELHMNYYAATALLAKVYRMKGDYDLAKTEAVKVIESGKFTLSNPDEIGTMLSSAISPKETIFGLYINDYAEYIQNQQYITASNVAYLPYDSQDGSFVLYGYTDVYNQYIDGEGVGLDNRLAGWFGTIQDITDANIYCTKFMNIRFIEDEITVPSQGFVEGYNMIRISEMYYIAAEADLRNYNTAGATVYLDEVLFSRGLNRLNERPISVIPDLAFLYNERHKEFFMEPQRWFDMKKLNFDIESNNDLITIPASDDIYVFPIPDEEYEFR